MDYFKLKFKLKMEMLWIYIADQVSINARTNLSVCPTISHLLPGRHGIQNITIIT